MGEKNQRISRRRVMSKAAATGVGLGLVRSSNQYSPVQTATASHDPIKYAKSFGDGNDNEYHYTDGSLWDCSIATSFGVLQTGFGHQQADDTCGHNDYYRHHITIWGAGFFTRTRDDYVNSGANLLNQYTKISTSADHCDPGPLLYSGNDGGNRFFSLRARNPDPCPHEDQTPAQRWFKKNHKEGEDYDNYEDVDKLTDEWDSEHPSDKDDFNTVKAANGIFGAVLGMYGVAATTVGLANAFIVPVSLFAALSELGQGNGASISNDNQEIEFWHNPSDAGILANMVEFTALVPEDESFEVTVDMSIGVPEESTCYGEPLRDNVVNNQCIDIHIPSNTESDDYVYYIYASECN